MYRFFVSFLVLTAPMLSFGQSNDVCSTFILKTLEHMKWDGEKGEGDFILAVVGDSDLERTLARKAAALKVREKNVLIRPFDADKLAEYNLVYVANADAKKMHRIISEAPKLKTVVITQDEGRLTEDAFIKLLPEGEKIRFALNSKQFLDAGVMISPVIARLAVKAAP